MYCSAVVKIVAKKTLDMKPWKTSANHTPKTLPMLLFKIAPNTSSMFFLIITFFGGGGVINNTHQICIYDSENAFWDPPTNKTTTTQKHPRKNIFIFLDHFQFWVVLLWSNDLFG